MNTSLTGLLFLGGFVLLNAFFKLAYVALINASRSKLKELEEEGQQAAGRALALANDATRMLASQQLIDLVLRFMIALVAAQTLIPPLRDALSDQLGNAAAADVLAYGGVLLALSLVTMVLSEMLPSNIALGHADIIAIRVVSVINLLARILTPIVQGLQRISGLLAAPLVGRTSAALVTEEEIMMMVDAGQEGGAIEDEEKEMIYSIIQFGDTLAREVMVPRIDIVALEIQASITEALRTIVDAGHSRIPIYEESIDHIRGLLYAKDLLELLRDGKMESPLADLLRPAYFVPESKKAGDLLGDLQQQKIHLAIVVDEYGGTAGIVTVEDLIEEIVGEIRDEYDDKEQDRYEKIDEFEYVCDAGIDLDDLNRMLDVRLPTDESDTLGGYVFSALGRVPVEGEQIETEDLHLEVISVNDRRIRKIRVIRKPLEAAADDETHTEEQTPPDWKAGLRALITVMVGFVAWGSQH